MPDTAPAVRPMRADARHNRELILEAARQLLVESGADVPLDQVARRAGVSIATFYRRFEDRTDLLRAVVFEEFSAMLASLERITAQVEEGIGHAEWVVLMHRMVTSSRSRMVPVLVAMGSGMIPLDGDLVASHQQVDGRFERLVDTAKSRGLIRADTDHLEIRALLVSASQPLPPLTAAQNHDLASRMVGVVLAGLHPAAAGVPLQGQPFHLPPLDSKMPPPDADCTATHQRDPQP